MPECRKAVIRHDIRICSAYATSLTTSLTTFLYFCTLFYRKKIPSMQLSEQELVRRQKLEEIKTLGINPYPSELFEVNITTRQIREEFEESKKDAFQQVSIAGRLMSNRIMGKAAFGVLQDSTGKIQFYIVRDEICPGED